MRFVRRRGPMPYRLWLWCDKIGRIPWFVRVLWPTAHWCPEFDDLLVEETMGEFKFCQCQYFKEKARERRDTVVQPSGDDAVFLEGLFGEA